MVTNIHETGDWTGPRNGTKYWEKLGSIRVRKLCSHTSNLMYKNVPDHLRYRNYVNFLCDSSLSLCISTTLRCKTCQKSDRFIPEFEGRWAPQLICTLWYSKASTSAENRSSVVQHIAFSRHAIRSLTRIVHENEWLFDCSRSFTPVRNS
jgi:hypothetical protein